MATFTAAASQSYGFRLTVTNTDGLKSSASTTVSTVQATQVQIGLGSPPTRPPSSRARAAR